MKKKFFLLLCSCLLTLEQLPAHNNINNDINVKCANTSIGFVDPSGNTTSLVKPSSIEVDDTIYLELNETYNLNVTFTPEETSKCYKGLTYSSSNDKVAIVDSNGKVTAVAFGECNINVFSTYDSNIFSSCKVMVGSYNDIINLLANNQSTIITTYEDDYINYYIDSNNINDSNGYTDCYSQYKISLDYFKNDNLYFVDSVFIGQDSNVYKICDFYTSDDLEISNGTSKLNTEPLMQMYQKKYALIENLGAEAMTNWERYLMCLGYSMMTLVLAFACGAAGAALTSEIITLVKTSSTGTTGNTGVNTDVMTASEKVEIVSKYIDISISDNDKVKIYNILKKSFAIDIAVENTVWGFNVYLGKDELVKEAIKYYENIPGSDVICFHTSATEWKSLADEVGYAFLWLCNFTFLEWAYSRKAHFQLLYNPEVELLSEGIVLKADGTFDYFSFYYQELQWIINKPGYWIDISGSYLDNYLYLIFEDSSYLSGEYQNISFNYLNIGLWDVIFYNQ